MKEASYMTYCEYLNFNEVLVSTDASNDTRRRRRDVTTGSNSTNSTEDIARLVDVTISNNGVNYSLVHTLAVLNIECQNTSRNANGDYVLVLKVSFCFHYTYR